MQKFRLRPASKYIILKQGLQQIAPVEKYRTDEKLIYKFISNKPVFAYDNQQSLTLNSANILIPRFDNIYLKVVLALLNSTLYQFLYQKQFGSIKILRSHLEALPFPDLDTATQKRIIRQVDEILYDNADFTYLDNFIFSIFELNKKEIKHIKRSVI